MSKKEKENKCKNNGNCSKDIDESKDNSNCGCGDCSCNCDDDNDKNLEIIADLQNKLMYKEAEFVNYRRRKDEEVQGMLKYANQDLILDILSSIDNFERAIDSIKKDDNNSNILTGIEMIYNELVNTLKKYGVEEINQVDCKFDPSIHNAIMTDSSSDKENDTVLEILTKGYKLKDKLIRPAMVKVNSLEN